MIHSLSGGVIRDNGPFTFAKVEAAGEVNWYLCPFSGVKAGDRVLVPRGYLSAEGVVLKTEEATRDTAPAPMNRMREIEKVL